MATLLSLVAPEVALRGYPAAQDFLSDPPLESTALHILVDLPYLHGLNPEHPTDPVAHSWPRIKETACLSCHNERQTGTKFSFFRSRKKVACRPKMERTKK